MALKCECLFILPIECNWHKHGNQKFSCMKLSSCTVSSKEYEWLFSPTFVCFVFSVMLFPARVTVSQRINNNAGYLSGTDHSWYGHTYHRCNSKFITFPVTAVRFIIYLSRSRRFVHHPWPPPRRIYIYYQQIRAYMYKFGESSAPLTSQSMPLLSPAYSDIPCIRHIYFIFLILGVQISTAWFIQKNNNWNRLLNTCAFLLAGWHSSLKRHLNITNTLYDVKFCGIKLWLIYLNVKGLIKRKQKEKQRNFLDRVFFLLF